MPKTLLVVDDSATMRKVLEITFSGDDFRVITADGSAAALGRMSEEPRVVLIDTALGPDDGYALCREIRRRDPSAAIVMLSSRHNPYDAAQGRCAARAHVHYVIQYQPASHYWALQGMEAAIFIGMAIALLAVSGIAVRQWRA